MLSRIRLVQKVKKVECMLCQMEALRAHLHETLDAAGGSQLDPAVQRAAEAFDAVHSRYQRSVMQQRFIQRPFADKIIS